MVNQGRLVRVMLVLMASMTAGALTLLALEGKPIRPMAFSLTSETRLNPVHKVLGLSEAIAPGRWNKVEISYEPNNGQLTDQLGLTGLLARNYHFVISDGSGGADGQIFASPQWIKQQQCNPDSGISEKHTIRICLIGDPNVQKSTPNQARQLEALVSSLIRYCHMEPNVVWKS